MHLFFGYQRQNEDGLDALEQTIRDMFEQGMIAGNDEVVITKCTSKNMSVKCLRKPEACRGGH